MIRLTAVGYLLFFVPDLIFASTHHVNGLPPLLARLFDWGDGGDPVAVMFSTVYIVWALFLYRSANAPLANRLFLDFNLTANESHRERRALRRHARHGRCHARRAPAPGGRGGARIAHHRPAGRMLASGAAPQRPLNAGGAPLGMVEWISPDTDTRE
jgi:hypothetical protein